MSDDKPDRHWHLDRRVPIAIIFAIFVQTCGAIWWAATISANVGRNQERIEEIRRQSDELGKVSERVARLEAIMDEIRQLMREINRKVGK